MQSNITKIYIKVITQKNTNIHYTNTVSHFVIIWQFNEEDFYIFPEFLSALKYSPSHTAHSVKCLSAAAAAAGRLSTSLTLDTGHKRPGCWVLTLSPATTPELSTSASPHLVTLNNVAFLKPWNKYPDICAHKVTILYTWQTLEVY